MHWEEEGEKLPESKDLDWDMLAEHDGGLVVFSSLVP